MRIINLRQVQAIEGRLLEQLHFLRKTKVELERSFAHVLEMCRDEKTLQFLKEAIDEIEEEAHTLQQMVHCVQGVREAYSETEKRIVETYDWERIMYPRPTFGRSVITGLDGLKGLLPF